MKLLCNVLAVVLSALLIVPVSARAEAGQQSIVNEADIEGAIQQSLMDDQAAREDVRSLLRRSDVRELASDLALDSVTLDRASEAVDTLDPEELEQVSGYAAEVHDELAGGATVTISLVALLLIVIIVILLAD